MHNLKIRQRINTAFPGFISKVIGFLTASYLFKRLWRIYKGLKEDFSKEG